jgi:hypothetical protein
VLALLPHEPLVQAEASVPTRHGVFRFLVFHAPGDPATDHVALVAGDVEREDVLVGPEMGCVLRATPFVVPSHRRRFVCERARLKHFPL